jgi:uncharacterized protein (DUF1015 family)
MMAVLRPFRALRYNPAVVGELSAVVAPPYDVISPARRDALYDRSEHNAVRLILNRAADPYADAARLLNIWRRDGVLRRDARPSLCYHVEEFVLPNGAARRREGVIGAVRLEPFRTGRIRPHERTFSRHKEDRMRLLQAVRTNLSPIFALFADQAAALDPARAVAATREPDLALADDTGVRHRAWLLTESAPIAAISDTLENETLFIADGHHRYETGLAYAEEARTKGATDPNAPHNFIMMYLASMNDPGLVILPTHRVLSGTGRVTASELLTRLRRHFRLTPFARGARDELLAGLREQQPQGGIGVVIEGSDAWYVATLADPAALDTYAAHLAPAVRRLDVAVLDSVILRGLLGIDCSAAAHDGQLTYTHDDDDALRATEKSGTAFLMNAPRIADVQAVCLAGETMPEKSTYFYPKLPTGLVFRPLDDADDTVPAM